MNRLFYITLCVLISTGMAMAQLSGDNSGITMKGKPVTLLGTKALKSVLPRQENLMKRLPV